MLTHADYAVLEETHPQIAQVGSKLGRMAAVYGQSIATPDDLEQDMILALLEKSQAFYAKANDSYIVHAARYQVWGSMRAAQTEGRYTVEDYSDDDNLLDVVASDDISPEDALIAAEDAQALARVMRSLSGREREVVLLAVSGVRTSEIAQKWGCSPAAVSCYKSRVAKKLHAAIA